MSLREKLGLTGAAALVVIALVAAMPAAGQYPGQIQPKDKDKLSMRSVVVVEWTGDQAKPKASRVIPISVWDGNELQDGGIYLARPAPLALGAEVEYILQQNGKKAGLFDIQEAARQQNSWIGFGKWKPLPKGPSPEELARMQANTKIDADDENSDKPILHRKQHPEDAGNNGSGSAQKSPAPDTDRPTLHRGQDAGAGSDDSPANAEPPPDPDRPKLHAGAKPADDDSDRPKLQNKPQGDDNIHVSSVADATDPDRPKLARGIPAGYGKEVIPNLMGMPAEMQQEVGISDPREIKDHPWDFTWADPDDQRKMKEALEEEARKALGLNQPPAPAPKRTTASAHRKSTPPSAPSEPAPLVDEQFRVFELSYGGGATMVFSARTDGAGADQKFVTLIAQPDLYGRVVVLLKNVTDAAHLDVKPRMRLVDAVDAMADNRGELLFELRGQSQRQFALYRVLRGQISQIFETTSTFFGSAGE